MILDGKKFSEEILADLKQEIAQKQLRLKLAVVLVGKDKASNLYIERKKKTCENIGVGFELFNFNENISYGELKNEIKNIVQNPKNKGVIIQLPLPKNLPMQDILDLVVPEKDVDVLSSANIAKFYTGKISILPPPVSAIEHLFKKYKISIIGKNIVVVGSGRLVGLPLAIWALKEKATFSVLNQDTKNISLFTKEADILISGVGKPGIIKGNMVKNGAIVIDAGTSFKNGRALGDVDFKSVSKKAKYITPVPGGLGPMTVACLLENLVKLNR